MLGRLETQMVSGGLGLFLAPLSGAYLQFVSVTWVLSKSPGADHKRGLQVAEGWIVYGQPRPNGVYSWPLALPLPLQRQPLSI